MFPPARPPPRLTPGERNHGRFLCYLAAQTALAAWTLHLLVAGLAPEPAPDAWLAANLLPLLAALVAGAFCLFLGALLGFHSYLAATNQTTWEVSRRDHVPYLRNVPRGVAPFSRGSAWRNVPEMCCPPDNSGALLHPALPPRAELEAMARRESWADNRIYSCF